MTGKSGFTSLKELVAAEQKRFDSGGRIKEHLQGAFPVEVKLKHPHSRDLKENFEESIAWARFWNEKCPQLLKLKDISTSLHFQKIPCALIFKDIEALCAFIGRSRELKAYRSCHSLCEQKLPDLLPFIEEHPKFVLEHSDKFARLLEICWWLKEHPRPGIYLRELDLPGIDTKFLEKGTGVPAAAGRLLDVLLPPSGIDGSVTAGENFAKRYGFKLKPVFVRMHFLDKSAPQNAPYHQFADFQCDKESFAKLRFDIDNIVICENEVSYLALPPLPRTLAVFGQGYGFAGFGDFACFKGRRIIYWGDLDTDGFRILNELRAQLPCEDLISVLMDEQSIKNFAHLAVRDPNAATAPADLSYLTAPERAAYEALRLHRYGESLRIEQERLPFTLVCKVLREAIRQGPARAPCLF